MFDSDNLVVFFSDFGNIKSVFLDTTGDDDDDDNDEGKKCVYFHDFHMIAHKNDGCSLKKRKASVMYML